MIFRSISIRRKQSPNSIGIFWWLSSILILLDKTRAAGDQENGDSNSNGMASKNTYISVEKIQQQNMEILEEAMSFGWQAFCDAQVDEGVMSLFSGTNPSDATIHVMTLTKQSVELPIKLISEIRDFDINPDRKTLLYVNGYYTPNGFFSVLAHLKMLQTTRRDLNVIIVNFARDLLQLYYAVRHHLTVQGYFVAKILDVLIANGVAAKDITLVGHSVGANIAALGAILYARQSETQSLPGGVRVGQLVAIDPARMCQASDVYVQRNVSDRVVVIHGESEYFGLRNELGSINIYPNGIGAIQRRKAQPGCDTPLCSHMYPFILFMEALIEGVVIPAVKCDSWLQFRKLACDYNDIAVIGLKYSANASGSYFCMTQANPPFTFMEHGLKYKKIS